ncbi:hypothetical protein F5051DRAFT_341786, partial [Lentinula edodes]
WLYEIGLPIAPDKLELSHHSWRHNGGYLPPVFVVDVDGMVTKISAQDAIRILGVYLDRELTFIQYIRTLTDKAMAVVSASRMCQVHASGLHTAARYSEDPLFIVILLLLFFLATHTLSF